jgi:predicted AlkP superfamily phosphohydrolase/phosphomutase
MAQGSRVLILGLDGASWDLIDRFVAEGHMPHMAELIRGGLRAPLNSTMPPMTLPSWSSMLTGTNPGKHGIFDFVHRKRPSWELEFVNSTHRGVPTLHQVLSGQGARVASLCVPTTWPPETVNGVVVSGFDSPVSTGIDASHCSPSSLFSELKARFDGLNFADFNECRIDQDWHRRARAALLAEIPRKEAIARWLLSRERWDLMMLLWGEIDTACHHFWSHWDPKSPRHDPSRAALGSTIREVYQSIDESIGRLVEAASPELVCVCSDHGFGGASAHVLYLNRYLQEHGWLRFLEPSTRRRSGVLDGARLAVAQRVPHRLQGALFRALPDRLLDRAETASRLGRIDIPASRALSDEMNYAATIRLNLPRETHREAVDDLAACLGAWEVDGQRVLKALHYREDIYWGDHVERSPELVLELALREGYSYTLLPSISGPGPSWEKLHGSALQGAKGVGMNGSHRQQGILLFAGNGVAQGLHEEAQMFDIAPSILNAMGAGVPGHMDGQVLWGSEPMRQPGRIQMPPGPRLHLGRAGQEALRGRLQRLGYL